MVIGLFSLFISLKVFPFLQLITNSFVEHESPGLSLSVNGWTYHSKLFWLLQCLLRSLLSFWWPFLCNLVFLSCSFPYTSAVYDITVLSVTRPSVLSRSCPLLFKCLLCLRPYLSPRLGNLYTMVLLKVFSIRIIVTQSSSIIICGHFLVFHWHCCVCTFKILKCCYCMYISILLPYIWVQIICLSLDHFC